MIRFKNWLRHWWDIVIFIFVESIYLSKWLPKTNWFEENDITVNEEFWKIVVPLSKDSLVASIVAISILLPSTVAILYYIPKNADTNQIYIKNAITSFSYASYIFILSLLLAIIDLAFMPMRLKLYQNITLDWVIAFYATTHYLLFLLGVFKLLRGLMYLFKKYQ
jgi:hypothetical protein